jgi:hypothetical protein
MAIETSNYLDLITSEYQNSTRFMAWLAELLDAIQSETTLVEAMDAKFDLDAAIGPQLDVVGEEVGLSRRLKVQILTSDVGFTWESLYLGWDAGIWIQEGATTLLELPDDSYRQALKIKIAANSWDGSIPLAYEIFENLFQDDITIMIQNNLNMTMDFMMIGEQASILLQWLFYYEYISFRPAGVGIKYHINATGWPFFAWDLIVPGLFDGWDEAVWSEEGWLGPIAIYNYLITEDEDYLVVETGLSINAEDGSYVLAEDGTDIETEESTGVDTGRILV